MSEKDGVFVKYDKDKNPLHLLPTVALEKVGEVLAFGAKKYASHGWRKVDKRSRYYSALIRHAFQWWRGETVDEETKLPHLAHLACCALFLLESELLNYGEDDRPSLRIAELTLEGVDIGVLRKLEADLTALRTQYARLDGKNDELREANKILEQELFNVRGMTK